MAVREAPLHKPQPGTQPTCRAGPRPPGQPRPQPDAQRLPQLSGQDPWRPSSCLHAGGPQSLAKLSPPLQNWV